LIKLPSTLKLSKIEPLEPLNPTKYASQAEMIYLAALIACSGYELFKEFERIIINAKSLIGDEQEQERLKALATHSTAEQLTLKAFGILESIEPPLERGLCRKEIIKYGGTIK